MITEMNSWDVRAARHAALADPARLRLLDLLAVGDMSPTELRTGLDGMASNLLAHHLKVLEREGIVSRGRSEGDRRRSYVRLNPGALEDLGTFPTMAVERVVFVCSANSARSQIAQALWNDASTIPAVSAGTHPADRVAAHAVAVAARHGFDLARARPQHVEGLLRDTDFVVTVCDRAHEEFPVRAVHWSVPDPVPASTDEAFESAFADLAERIALLAPRLIAPE